MMAATKTVRLGRMTMLRIYVTAIRSIFGSMPYLWLSPIAWWVVLRTLPSATRPVDVEVALDAGVPHPCPSCGRSSPA